MHQPVADAVRGGPPELGYAGSRRRAQLRESRGGRAGEQSERRVGGNGEVGVEVEDFVGAGPGPFDKRSRCAGRRQVRTVQVGGQIAILGGPVGDAGADERGREAGEHLRPVEGEGLRAEEGRAGRVEHVHAHVVGVWPDGELGIVEEVCAEMKAIAVIRAGGIARDGDGDALVGRDPGACELADDPAVGELVVDHDRVAVAIGLANAAKAGPDRGDARRPQHRGTRGLVEDLIAFVDDLDVLRRAHLAIGVRRRAIARHTREGGAVEVQNGAGDTRQ